MNGRIASVWVVLVLGMASACGGGDGDDTPGECTPSCEAKECGDDGCGDVCGTCPGAAPYCVQNKCSVECAPDCDGLVCGDDGCGGSCGTCAGSQDQCLNNQCVCQPDCVGHNCGDDGCGGTCGTCDSGQFCEVGACVPCTCDGKECGDDECGNTCGECPEVAPYCYDNLCSVDCVPECTGSTCGDDGCGGSCGTCNASETCVDNQCSCQPQCADSECGDDGCGGSCGTCPPEASLCLAGSCLAEVPPDTPLIDVAPTLLDFGPVVNKGDSPVKHITVTNTGTGVLLIDHLVFLGSQDFSVVYDTKSYIPGQDIPFDPPVALAPSELTLFSVQFAPQTPDLATGTVVFFTNDLTQPNGTEVELKANQLASCIMVHPKKVQFGGKLVGVKAVLPVEISNCGTAPLSVTKLQWAAGSDVDFTLDTTSLVGFEDGSAVSATQPLVIPVVKEAAVVNVVYEPSQESPFGNDGQPVFDVGTITIESNALEATVEVDVSGLGVTKECPTAVGVILEGQEVIPQTVLHLFGDQSFPTEEIKNWEWTVSQPTGSPSVFVPSNTFFNPTFEANVVGTYEFQLEVWDAAGVKSCSPWVQEVVVVPDETIHVEFVWTTPDDPDETDEGPNAGSDLDLHFVHRVLAGVDPQPDLDKNGDPDPWYQQPYDCFWFNAHPDWGIEIDSVDDDPGLDRDDTDGAGPENMNLNIPQNGVTYGVGVHYWTAHNFGPSFATIRIYISGHLEKEIKDVKLDEHDMWDVADIHWPTGEVTLIQTASGDHKITPNYQNPFFFQN